MAVPTQQVLRPLVKYTTLRHPLHVLLRNFRERFVYRSSLCYRNLELRRLLSGTIYMFLFPNIQSVNFAAKVAI